MHPPRRLIGLRAVDGQGLWDLGGEAEVVGQRLVGHPDQLGFVAGGGEDLLNPEADGCALPLGEVEDLALTSAFGRKPQGAGDLRRVAA